MADFKGPGQWRTQAERAQRGVAIWPDDEDDVRWRHTSVLGDARGNPYRAPTGRFDWGPGGRGRGRGGGPRASAPMAGNAAELHAEGQRRVAEAAEMGAEIEALDRYMGPEYTVINQSLYTRDPELYHPAVGGMDALFDSPVAVSNLDEVKVYRGMSAGETERLFGGTDNDDPVVTDGYMSTTHKADEATSFSQGGITMEITVPPGARMLPGDGAEGELIFPRGSMLLWNGDAPRSERDIALGIRPQAFTMVVR